MKWFKRIILGLIGLCLIALGLDIFISRSLLKSNLFDGEYNVWNDIFDRKIDDDLVIYGSSRSYVHVNPKILDKELDVKSYNLGFNGQKIEIQRFRHDVLLEKGVTPKNVILNLDISSLVKLEKDPYLVEQFIPLLLFNNNLFKIVGQNLNLKKIDIYIPLIRYRNFNLKTRDLISEIYKIHMYSNYKHSNRVKGFRGIIQNWEEKDHRAYEIIIDSLRTNDLFIVIEDLQKLKTNVILINSPEYISQIKSQTNRKEIIDLYQSIASKYNIPFIDYSNDSMNYRKELFYNSNHLNAKGADIFTEKLAKDIKPYLKY